MKKILFTLLIFIFTAGVAFAESNFTIKGDFSVRGSHIKNEELASTDAATYDYYDQDMNIYAKFIASKTTWANLKIAINDEEWGTVEFGQFKDSDENIAIERAYMTHVFPTHTVLVLGKMDGGTWGTAFGDDKEARYRVKVVQPLSPKAILLGVIEKGGDVKIGQANTGEQGYIDGGTKDAEKDDNDRYAVGAILTFGDFHVKPLYYMVKDSSACMDQSSNGMDVNIMFLALDGKFGMFGFEAEYMSKDIDTDPCAGGFSWTLPGMYVNVWADLAPAKVGLIYADGGTDTNKGVEKAFDNDDDFDLTLFLSDWVGFGGGDGLTGMNAIQVYGSYKFSDKMSANASYTMVDSNWDAGDYKGAEATEMDFGLGYAITKNLTYSIAAGFASIDAEGSPDPEDGARIYHKLKMKF
ncbi:MAG: hypothetical protein JRJ57_05000 [Deltaproteobacteria bacterium]|nr:hypothetical protein [Deltaproteobacteria bacterium]